MTKEEEGIQRLKKFRVGTFNLNKTVFSLIIICLVMLTVYFLVFLIDDTSIFPFVNKFFPSLIFLACLLAGYCIVRRDPLYIWSPLPWFLGSCAVYYGFGPLLYHFGTTETVWYSDQFYPVGERDLLRTNMLNAAGITLVLLGYLVCMAFIHKRRGVYSTIFNTIEIKRLLFALLVIGISVKYLLVIPYRMGFLGWVLPGSILNISQFTWVSIIVLFAIVHNGSIKYKVPLYFLIATELAVGLMSWSKLEVIVVLLMILLGKFLCEPRINRFLAGCFLIGLIYIFFLSPFVTFGRLSVRLEGTQSLGELSTTLVEYAKEGRLGALGQLPGVQGWWGRLNYANAQTFAMNSYDGGIPGDTYSLIPFTVVPRVLYPEKPLMTRGPEFNELVTGSDHAASGAGLFGEAYWNGGWLYVILSCLYAGLVFAIFAEVSMRHIAAWRLAYLPVALIGIMTGLRPDDWFVVTFVGSLLQAILLYLVIRFFVMPGITQFPRFKNDRSGSPCSECKA